MKRRFDRALPAAAVALALASGFAASLARTAAAAAPASGLRADVINELSAVEKQLVSLAEATPAEKYAWRPADGIRSVGEVYVHVAPRNYLLCSTLGVKRPDGTGPDMEKKIRDKATIVPGLKASYDYIRGAIEGLSDADLDSKVNFFGTEITKRAVLLRALGHSHEHLGQSIAYARMNGIAPPWTAAEAAAEKKATPKP
jgi:uncharacterized damage-inducible protein DinB